MGEKKVKMKFVSWLKTIKYLKYLKNINYKNLLYLIINSDKKAKLLVIII